MTPPKPHHQSKSLTKSLTLLLLPVLTLISPSQANTEKVIFTAPPPVSLSSLDAIHQNLPVLGPSTSWSVRTNLSRVFPPSQQDDEQGYASWLLLDDLTPGQRYELRVCWSALEPTAFNLDTYPLTTILSTPALLQSLTQHAKSTQHHHHQQSHQKVSTSNGPNNDDDDSVLLLRVLAAADYFSHHSSLMHDPPPVLVDLILDPYIYNVLPQSLVPTVCYLVVVGVVSWFVAKWVAGSLSAIASSATNDQTKKQN
ncbi:hypothetical protein V8C42DRAFT_306904 [Trichoderma barbatum]